MCTPQVLSTEIRASQRYSKCTFSDFFAKLLNMSVNSPENEENWREAYLEEMLFEYSDPITPDMVIELLSRKLFGQRVVEAIQRTDNPPDDNENSNQLLFGQEFGFVGFRHQGSIIPTQLSPLFKGEENKISLWFFASSHRASNLDITGSINFAFHTHPNIRASRLAAAIYRGRENPYSNIKGDLFSERDLKGFRSVAEEDTSLIFALGTKNRQSDGGKLLLVSFNSFASYRDFKPEEVVARSIEYNKTPGKDYLDAYREAGLNVAVLSVNLNSDKPLAQAEIENASRLITQRDSK